MDNNKVLEEMTAVLLSRTLTTLYNLEHIRNSPAPQNKLLALHKLSEAGKNLSSFSANINTVHALLHEMRVIEPY